MEANGKQKLYIRVDGIYCEHCVETIKSALRVLDGVESAALRRNVAELTGESLPPAAVIVINQKFFVSGTKALIARAPNMDTLVSLGSAVSFAWSAYVFFRMTGMVTQGRDNMSLMELYLRAGRGRRHARRLQPVADRRRRRRRERDPNSRRVPGRHASDLRRVGRADGIRRLRC